MKHGYGRLIRLSGAFFEGIFKYSKKQGPVKFMNREGLIFQNKWVDDTLNRR